MYLRNLELSSLERGREALNRRAARMKRAEESRKSRRAEESTALSPLPSRPAIEGSRSLPIRSSGRRRNRRELRQMRKRTMPRAHIRKPLAEALSKPIDDIHRAMLSPRAADGDGEIATVVSLIFRHAGA